MTPAEWQRALDAAAGEAERRQKAAKVVAQTVRETGGAQDERAEQLDRIGDVCADIAAAIRAIPFPADLDGAGVGWQPIETAQRDAKARLVWVPGNQCIYCVSWRENPEYPWGGEWVIFGGGWRDAIQRPTHWMPLPAPPPRAGDTP